MPADLTTLLIETLRKQHNKESNCVPSFVLTRLSTKCLLCPTYLLHTHLLMVFDSISSTQSVEATQAETCFGAAQPVFGPAVSRFYDILMAPNSIRLRDRRRPFKVYGGDLSLRRVHGRCYQCQRWIQGTIGGGGKGIGTIDFTTKFYNQW